MQKRKREELHQPLLQQPLSQQPLSQQQRPGIPPQQQQQGKQRVSLQAKIKLVIERCLLHYFDEEELVSALNHKLEVNEQMGRLIWKKMKEQNKQFFEAYMVRVRLCQQVHMYNALVRKQRRSVAVRRPPPTTLSQDPNLPKLFPDHIQQSKENPPSNFLTPTPSTSNQRVHHPSPHVTIDLTKDRPHSQLVDNPQQTVQQTYQQNVPQQQQQPQYHQLPGQQTQPIQEQQPQQQQQPPPPQQQPQQQHQHGTGPPPNDPFFSDQSTFFGDDVFQGTNESKQEREGEGEGEGEEPFDFTMDRDSDWAPWVDEVGGSLSLSSQLLFPDFGDIIGD